MEFDARTKDTAVWRELRSAIDKRVDKLKAQLETCSVDKLSDLQARLKELRKLVNAVEGSEVYE